MAFIIGIDLGTTHSLVAVMKGDRPEIIANRLGQRLTPSVVGLDKNGQVHVGQTARNQLTTAPERTIAEVKRLMGSGERVKLGDRTYSPQEISGFILKALKDDAERALGEPVIEAVITVPAYFTDTQRQATKDAGALAGLKVERILNEPTAAALAYGIDHLDKEQFVLVYDLGGGTFDVSVLELFEGVLDVKASAGNNHLGGADFDAALVDDLAAVALEQHGVDLKKEPKARARLKSAAETAKIELSTLSSTLVNLPFVAVKDGEPVSLEVEVTREKFESLVGALIRSTLVPVESALKDAKLEKAQIAEIVLVGGSSRIPMVQSMLRELFAKAPRAGVNPDEAIALGAAIQGALKSGGIKASQGIMIADVAPFTLGVEVMGRARDQMVSGLFSPIIPRNCKVPVSRTETYFTTSDNQKSVEVRIFQGEDRFVRNNVLLDAYTVEGLPAKTAGQESIDISFTYDINGILNVKTRVNSTGKEAALQVDKRAQRLSPLERDEAKARLEREWPSGAPAVAAPSAPDKLLWAAQAKLDGAGLAADLRSRLAAGVEAVKRARAAGDKLEVTRAETALTDALFDADV